MTGSATFRAPRGAAFQLTREQERLLTSLRARDGRFGSRVGDMYLGALVVCSQMDNPERLSQAAQSMRELLEKLPRQLDDAPVQVPGTKASDRLHSLSSELTKTRTSSNCYDRASKGWKLGEKLDIILARLLERLEETIHQHTTNPKNRDVNRHFIKKLEPATDPLGSDREDELLKEWRRLDSYFQGVAHHYLETTPAVFEEYISTCTSFLLERVRLVTTFTNFQQIDAAIEEVERDA
jgi:hypothetical protein